MHALPSTPKALLAPSVPTLPDIPIPQETEWSKS